MGLRRRFRRSRKAKSATVEKASDVGKGVIEIDPIERLAELKANGAEVTAEVSRIGGDGSPYRHKNFEIEDIEPLRFREQIGEAMGGGTYKFELRKRANSNLLRIIETGKPERHKMDVEGKPKGQELIIKTERPEKKRDDIPAIYQIMVEQQNKNMELVITALAAGNGNGKSDPIELIKLYKEIAGDAGVDPFQYMTGFMQLMNQYNQTNRAPVQTTGTNSTGMDKFFEGLGAAVPAFAPLIASRLNPGPADAAALPANPNTFAGAGASPENRVLERPTVGPTPAITPENPGAVVNPLDALSAPLSQIEGGPADPSRAAYGAIMKLRYVISQRDDPHSIAAELVDSVNLILGAERIGGMWQNFITDENAGAMFDQYAPLIPELAADPGFTSECRAALIEIVHEQLNPDVEEEVDQALGQSLSKDGEVEDEVVDSQDEPEQVDSRDEAEDDGPEGGPGDDDG